MKENWLYKLERKFGKYAIHGLMRYVVAIEIIGFVIGIINPNIYYAFFSLDFSAIARGQVWRLVTFIFYPEVSRSDMMGILFFGIMLYVYYSIGNTLENVWGAFRFNVYYISGVVLSVIAGLIMYLTVGMPVWPVGFTYLNQALFLAFATIFPDIEFLLFYILPVKAKWLGIVYVALMGLDVFKFLKMGALGVPYATAIIISMLNFIVFFLSSRNMKKYSYSQRKRKAAYKRDFGPKVTPMYRHRCAVCGRTERDNSELEFRYCSKCDGNYEYCSDHIYTHEHVHR